MARPYRLESEGCLYHITSRGNERRDIFIVESDFLKFLDYLSRCKEKYDFYLYAYVLMSNHYHLLLETPHANLSRIMQYLNTSYTTYFNIKNKRSGHLFQGRYKSLVIDKDAYLIELTRYIHLNPVRAKMVNKPEDYIWSSYHEYITNKRKKKRIIDKELLKEYADISPKRYRDYVLSAIGEEENLFKDVYGGMILGTVKFIKETLKDLKDQIEQKDVSYRRELTQGPEINDIIEEVAKKYKKEKEEIVNRKRDSGKERKIAIYIIKRLTGKTNREIGEHFGISYSAVSKATGEIETKMKNDKRLEREVKQLISQFKV